MNVQQSVKMILARFNARKFDARVAREELNTLVEYATGEEKAKLLQLIRVFRRPGFDTPEFKAALATFQSTQSEPKEVLT